MPVLNPPAGNTEPLKIYGSRICRGNLDASMVEVLGHLHVSGELITSRLKLKGECSIGLTCNAQEITSLGSLRVHDLQAVKVVSDGYLSVTRVAAAEEFLADGCVRIDRLSCKTRISIKLGTLCKVRHLMSEGAIIVSPSSRLIQIPLNPLRRLQCETIEGADLSLYRTSADNVSGVNVTIGSGCVIQEIRYSGTLTLHPKSQVGKITRINDPEGRD
ncbi:hypothetical protein HQN87_24090 [Paenibacillus tritici]|uniref:Adhesin domain-containing protein n=1 Tax=Paenibacillus tritici TaxID=1873425 RepID=A0ABX2DUN9_9BACL|nr:hypothetical protein [Paenibacillus tritici]NQX48414.1 hypothetical protein [Paenibacillus tritici]